MDCQHTYGRRALGLLILSGVMAGWGCGSKATPNDSGSTDAATDAAADAPETGSDGSVGADSGLDASSGLDGGGVGEDCGGVFVAEVRGALHTEDGAPIAGARPQACIRKFPDRALTCLEPPIADAAGAWVIEVPDEVQCWASAAIRMLLPEGGYATTYCNLDPAPAIDGVLTVVEPFVLYTTTPATTLPPLGDESAARTVIFDDGLEVEVVPARLGFGVDYAALTARRVPLGSNTPCFAEGRGLDGLYGFGEEGSADEGGFPVRIPNTTSIATGTAVELLLVGGLATTLADGTTVEEAELVVFGTGTVSSDGAFIVSDPGSELPYFTWLGYRVAP